MQTRNAVCPFKTASPPSATLPFRRGPLVMTVEEFETVRLIDFENLTQEECAQRMSVAVHSQRIYDGARKSLLLSWLRTRALRIEGGGLQAVQRNGTPVRARGCPRHSGCPRHGP